MRGIRRLERKLPLVGETEHVLILKPRLLRHLVFALGSRTFSFLIGILAEN